MSNLECVASTTSSNCKNSLFPVISEMCNMCYEDVSLGAEVHIEIQLDPAQFPPYTLKLDPVPSDFSSKPVE